MAYIFRCDACGYEEPLDMPCPNELHRHCQRCETPGCVECIPKEMCLDCIEDIESNERTGYL
jgi:hypothetical protein